MYPTIKQIKELYRSYMNLSSNQKILEEKNRRVKYILKIKDNVDLKELEKFGYTKHTKENAKVDYYKFTPIMVIQILKDRTITYQLPIGSVIKKEYIIIDNLVDDLIKADLVEKIEK